MTTQTNTTVAVRVLEQLHACPQRGLVRDATAAAEAGDWAGARACVQEEFYRLAEMDAKAQDRGKVLPPAVQKQCDRVQRLSSSEELYDLAEGKA